MQESANLGVLIMCIIFPRATGKPFDCNLTESIDND